MMLLPEIIKSITKECTPTGSETNLFYPPDESFTGSSGGSNDNARPNLVLIITGPPACTGVNPNAKPFL